MSRFSIEIEPNFYATPAKIDYNLDTFFTEKFRARVENIDYKFLPFHLYKKYKVYVKCQILYFLYLNPHKQFIQSQISQPIMDVVIRRLGFIKRDNLRICCEKTLQNLAENFTILSRKNKKTKQIEYYFNNAYERLFCYGLFWNKKFICSQLECMKFFHPSRILKFVRIMDFLSKNAVSSEDIFNSCLFGEKKATVCNFLKPLLELGLIKRFKQGKDYFYCLNN